MYRILVGYDGTPSARRALERTVTLWHAGDHVGVISVAPSETGAEVMAAPVVVSERRRRAHDLETATGYLAERGIRAEAIPGVGNPTTAICRTAADGRYDTVVVGRRNLSGMKRVLLGSVSSGVAAGAPCDVLIAR